MASPLNLDVLRTEVNTFINQAIAFTTEVEERSIDLTRASGQHEEISALFHRVLAHMNAFMALEPDAAEEFTASTEVARDLYEESQRLLSVYRASLAPALLPAPRLEALEPAPRLLYVPVTVIYTGKGQLFIRGEGASIALPPCAGAGRDTPLTAQHLSWEEGCLLPRLADHIYQATLVVLEGTQAKYKILQSDCTWCSVDNYSTDGTSPATHIPTFNQSSTLAIALDVGFGNKLAIFGQGLVSMGDKWVNLSWKEEEGCELKCLKPDLWGAELTLRSPDVEYKIAIIAEDGSIVRWEKGENRRLQPATEYVLHPDLGIAQGERSAPTAFTETPQGVLLDELAVAHWQAEAARRVRERPCFTGEGTIFTEEDIHEVHAISALTPLMIDEREFWISHTANGKAILMQETLEGCTAGTAAMLILDNHKTPSAASLTTRMASTYEIPTRDIKEAGLTPHLTRVADLNKDTLLQELKILLEKNGSAIVFIKQAVTDGIGHVVVVDAINEDLSHVRLRDPWHNWDITVKADVFLRHWKYFNANASEARVIQIQQP